MAKKKRDDSVTLFIRVTWFICFLVGAAVLYSAFRREEEIYTRLFAEQEKKFEFKAMHIACSQKYDQDVRNYPGCRPKKCGRYIMDNVITMEEVDTMVSILKRGLLYGGSSGGASILDLHTGAMSKGVHFINLYKLESMKKLFSPQALDTYRTVREKIQNALASRFGISSSNIYLTKPTFFSRLTNKPPLSANDEYWHPHVDKETYPSFHYTTLLYLNDYGIDFLGGQFKFLEEGNSTSIVQPKKGRILLFTSGKENTHFVERVTWGIRYAVTISFTCEKKEAIPDPVFSR